MRYLLGSLGVVGALLGAIAGTIVFGLFFLLPLYVVFTSFS